MELHVKKSIEKRIKSETTSLADNAFLEIDIRDFCPKKIFDIILINGTDADSTDKLNDIIKVAKDYEETACITFITYDEVLDTLNQFDYDILPDSSIKSSINIVLDEIKKTFSYLKPDSYPAARLAMLMKIKLIEVMCRHRKREMEKIEKRSVLFRALDTLTKECRKVKKEGKAQKDKNTAKDPAKVYMDTDSEIIFDDDIFNHVWYYVFEGFFNVKFTHPPESA